jgi:uncharacterized protein (TIGR02300 family)
LAIPELGAKQICPNCQAKFYDLTRRPAHCPKCEHEFDPEEVLRSRRGRRPGAGYAADDAEDQTADKKVTDEDEDEDAEISAPELDAGTDEPILTPDDDDDSPVDASEEAGMSTTDADGDLVDDDDDDSVPFIEDEDDDAFGEEIAKGGKDDDDR